MNNFYHTTTFCLNITITYHRIDEVVIQCLYCVCMSKLNERNGMIYIEQFIVHIYNHSYKNFLFLKVPVKYNCLKYNNDDENIVCNYWFYVTCNLIQKYIIHVIKGQTNTYINDKTQNSIITYVKMEIQQVKKALSQMYKHKPKIFTKALIDIEMNLI